jgi:hypothetical protein
MEAGINQGHVRSSPNTRRETVTDTWYDKAERAGIQLPLVGRARFNAGFGEAKVHCFSGGCTRWRQDRMESLSCCGHEIIVFFLWFNCVLLGKNISHVEKFESIAFRSIEWLHALLGSKSDQMLIYFPFFLPPFFRHNSSLLLFTSATFIVL